MPSEPRATIELTCVMLPDDPDVVEIKRTKETQSMWRRAVVIADRFGALHRSSTHHDVGEQCTYGDSYLYARLGTLEQLLRALDRGRVGYDNIDLPVGVTPASLIRRLQQRYPRGSGVMVNLKGYASRSRRPTRR